MCKTLAKAIGAKEFPLIPKPKLFEALVNNDEAKVMLLAAPPATMEEPAKSIGR